MQVILLDDVEHLGESGEVHEVADGREVHRLENGQIFEL